MQIVIDIPDESIPKIQEDLIFRVQFFYEGACNVGLYDSYDNLIGYVPFRVLPKGHGRLIDADALELRDMSPEAWYSPMWGYNEYDIEYAQTVLEADEEVE